MGRRFESDGWLMKIYVGDITNAPVDVIVNASDADFTPGGGLARWIEKKAGKKVFQEVQKNSPGAIGEVFSSGPGNLKAKAIYHIPTINWQTKAKLSLPEVQQTTVKALEMAIADGYKSIVFPLLAAGTVGLKEEEVAQEISDAILLIEEQNEGFLGGVSVLSSEVYERIKSSLPRGIEIINVPE
ncbi:Appr-1-p processing protein [bacterium]|nr:Appr-1-p processing protein [bacterium]